MKTANVNHSCFAPEAGQARRRGFVQSRLQNFGLTMIVMGISFGLYYLGLFGGVSGPLQPERIGERLASAGFTNRHLLMILLSFLFIAITWNWLYNIFNRVLGRNRTCVYQEEGKSGCCAMPIMKAEGDGSFVRYVCASGHQCAGVDFRVVKKGTVSHFFCAMLLVFSAMVVYLS